MNPKTKVFYNGKQLRTAHGQYGRKSFVARLKSWIWRFILKPLLFILGAATLMGLGFEFKGDPAMAITPEAIVVDKTPEKIDALKVALVQKVSDCERAGHSEEDGIIIFDSNARASIGVLQFQKATVISYYKTLYGKDISGKDAVEIALDKDKAFALAKDIIFTSKNGVAADWVNCSKKYNLQTQVDLIKQLEK